MKTLLKIAISISFIALSFSCKAQQIISLEDFSTYPKNLPDGAYLKDVNHTLDKYRGAWKGSYKGKHYFFQVDKTTLSHSKLKFKEDILTMRYKITDNNGNLIISTLSIKDNTDFRIIKGMYLAKTKTYFLFYLGQEYKCGQKGQILLRIFNDKKNNNKETMSFVFVPDRDVLLGENCDNVEQILPIEAFPLYRQ